MLLRFFLVTFLLLATACTSTKPTVTQSDPWQGQYQHFSSRFVLILDHISKEFVEVDIFELPRSNAQRPRASFVADLKDNKAIFQAGRGEKCRVELQLIDRGIIVSNFCNGTGEDTGLYRSIDEKVK